MPIFEYRALAKGGKNQKGIIEAETAKAARQRIKQKGLVVVEINERTSGKVVRSGKKKRKRKTGGGGSLFGGVSQADVSLLTRQLASLVKANIPVLESLDALVDQTDNDRLKIIVSEVRQDVKEGASLAKALKKHPKVFDTIFVNMVEAGESSGTLQHVLIRLADLKEAQMRLRGKVVAGMTYPALMGFVGAVLIIGIFAFVIPEMVKIFDSMNKPIPPMTQALVAASGFLTAYWQILTPIFVFLVIWFFRYINTAKGRKRWDRFRLNAPIFGPIIRMIAVERFARTMSTLLRSGVPILLGMKIARNLVSNVHIAKAIDNARENVTEGQSIAGPLKRSGEFPPLVIHMIGIGEKTGELPQMLGNVADTYEEQVSTKIEGLTSLLEPAMIVIMGGFVAFVVVAIFVPLLDMSNIR